MADRGEFLDKKGTNTVWTAVKTLLALKADKTDLDDLTSQDDVATAIAVALAEELKDYLPKSGGTMTGDINMDGNMLTFSKQIRFKDMSNSFWSFIGNEGPLIYFQNKTFKLTNAGMNVKLSGLNYPENNSDAANKQYVDTKIAESLSGAGITISIVDELPQPGVEKVIYFVPDKSLDEAEPILESGGEEVIEVSKNIYSEYMWINDAYEYIGNTSIDLSGYWSKSNLRAITAEELNEILV